MLTSLERAWMIEIVVFSNPRGPFAAAIFARINRSAGTSLTGSVIGSQPIWFEFFEGSFDGFNELAKNSQQENRPADTGLPVNTRILVLLPAIHR